MRILDKSNSALFARQKLFSYLEPVRPALGRILIPESGAHLLQQRKRPASIVEFVRGEIAGRLAAVEPLGQDCVEGNECVPAAALASGRTVPFVNQEVLYGGKQERAKTATRRPR